jgi:hypothetical protein
LRSVSLSPRLADVRARATTMVVVAVTVVVLAAALLFAFARR